LTATCEQLELSPGGATATGVAAVAVHYRQPRLLARMLSSLAGGGLPEEIVVVNNSPGVPVDVPPGLEGRVRVVPFRNEGYAGACNEGLKFTDFPVVAFCNSDLVFPPGAFERAAAFLDEHPDVGVLAPRLFYRDGREQAAARRFYRWGVLFWSRTGGLLPIRQPRFYRRHLLMDESEGPGGVEGCFKYNGSPAREVDWAVGACLFVRRAALEDPERAFDPRFPLYFEDTDLCLNMWRRGWKVVQLRDLHVVHRYRRASRNLFSRAGLAHVSSLSRFLLKHRGLPRGPS